MVGRLHRFCCAAEGQPREALGPVCGGRGSPGRVSDAVFGHVAVWSILLVGLFNSIMFPTIFTLGIAEMGPLTGEASGLLVTAIVGGAFIP